DKYTVSLTHPDGVVALLSGGNAINAHFTSPPFHQRERKDARVRTILTSDDVMGGSTTFTMLSTTTKFRDQNPKLYKAVRDALEEANQAIVADKRAASDLLLASGGESGFTAEEMFDAVNDPGVRFTTTPENVMKYAEFMAGVGSLKKHPNSWKDLFFS